MIPSFNPKANGHAAVTVRALFVDLDGTLLASDLSVPLACATSLRLAQERGVRVFLASGRHVASVARYVEMLQVDPYALVSNGCVVNTAAKEALFFQPFPRDTWVMLTELARKCGASPIIHAPTEWYIESIDDNVQIEVRRSGATPTTLGFARVDLPIIKVLMVGKEVALSKCQAELEARRSADLAWFTTFPEYLEVMPAGASKGTARDALLKFLGIPKANVMAIGDGSNDLDMLRDIGISVAVANAKASVLSMAHYIAPSNDEAGVAEAVGAFVFGQLEPYLRLRANGR